jgi:putative membrane protein
MMTLRNTLNAAVAALLVSSLGLSACEKAPNGGPTPSALDGSDAGASGSTVPALPALGGPMFSPDLVDRVGGLDLFAIAEAKVALARSQNESVKSFATASLNAHTNSVAALNSAINASNQTISMPDSMPNDLASKLADLNSVDAGKFDKAYVADQINALQAVDNALKTFAKHGDVAQFKAYSEKSMAGVESSLASAQTLQASLK